MSTFRQPEIKGRFEKSAQFFKVEDGIAYGWAIVCTEHGQPYWDLQNDHIPEDEMVSAAVEFMKHSRIGSDQHTGEHVGDIVFGLPVTKANASAFGIQSSKTGLLIGYQPQDPVHLDMIARGERTGFSIGGYLLDFDESEIGKAVWSTAFQDKLPDSSFAYVKPGGKKDKDGKTVPRSNRMFPYKDADGKVDAAHVSNGLSRLASSKLPADVKDKIKSKLEAAQKSSKGVAKSIRKDGSPDASDVYTPEDIGDQKKKPKGKVYRRFKIDEISLVTKPAQEGATVSFVKGATIRKADYDLVFTSSDDGHQHIVDVDDYDDDGCGCTSYAISADGEFHKHDWLRGDGGKIDIGDNAGHGHSVAATSPDQPDPEDQIEDAQGSMTGTVQGGSVMVVELAAKQDAAQNSTSVDQRASVPSMTEQEIAALNKRLARAEKMLTLSPSQLAYAKSLAEVELEGFLAKSDADRATVAKAAIAYTAQDGTVYFAHDDARVISMAKSNDSLSQRLLAEETLRKAAQFSKAAAEDMAHLEGDVDMHAAVIAAVEGIADENVRKAARTMLKAADAAVSKLGRSNGSNGAVGGKVEKSSYDSKQDELKTAVTKFQTDNKLGSYEEAFAKATQVDATVRKLYNEAMELRESAN